MNRADFLKRCAAILSLPIVARATEPGSEEIVTSGFSQAEPFPSTSTTVTYTGKSSTYTVAHYLDGQLVTSEVWHG